MMRIFTYHEVSAQPEKEKAEFYTISAEQLAHHLETFNARGWRSLRLQDLNGPPAENQYALTFDDGTRDHYEVVLPLLEKHRCRASFYIPTAKLNQPGYLTDAQVREIAVAGHEIGSHSHEHERMDVLSEQEVRRRIARSMEILAGITGTKSVTFVPPGGFTNKNVRKVAGELGIRALRTMKWGYNQKFDAMALETVPINRYADDHNFQKALEPHGKPLLYAGKEIIKKLVPLRQYERLRSLAFRVLKSH